MGRTLTLSVEVLRLRIEKVFKGPFVDGLCYRTFYVLLLLVRGYCTSSDFRLKKWP